MKKTILLLSILFLNSCSTAQIKLSKENNNIRNLIIDCYKNLESSNISLNDQVLKKVWMSGKKTESLINSDQFYLIQNFNIKSEEDVIKFNTFFTKEEFTSMKMQMKNSQVKKWSNLIGKEFIEAQQKQKFRKFFSFSTPVFNKDKTIGVIYVESPNSGELRVYKKEENEVWKYFATGLVWRAD